MAENIVIPSSYYIINRVLSPSGVKLAVQYNGPDNKLTLAPLDETNRNQRWVLERSRDKSTTIVPSNFEDQQAAPHDPSDSFVIAEVAVTPQLWVFKNDESIIQEISMAHSGPFKPGQGRIWGAEKAVPDEEVTLKYDLGGFAQRWVLQGSFQK